MKHSRIQHGVCLSLLGALTTTTIAQMEPIEIQDMAGPFLQEKVIDPSLLNAVPTTPEPVWDGEKPFMPEIRAAQSAIPAPRFAKELLDSFRPIARNAFNLTNVSVQEGRLATADGETRVAVTLDGAETTVRLHPYSLRSDQARLVVQTAGGMLVDTPWPEPATYRGAIDGMDVEVAASIRDGKISMLILPNDPDAPAWYMQPLSDAVDGMPPSLHIVYKRADVAPNAASCGVDDAMIPIAPPQAAVQPLAARLNAPGAAPNPIESDTSTGIHETSDAGNGEGGNSLSVANVRCQIGLDADFEFYQANGSSVLDTIYDMELIMNQVGLIYQNQVAIAYTETIIFVRTAEPDPYTATNANTLLCQFGEWWNNNVSTTRDVAHLFTGKDLDGTTVGLAWIGSICPTNFNNCNAGGSSLSYGLVQSRFTTDLNSRIQDSAHELGHNWNACHCNTGGNCGGGTSNPACGIMTSNISGQLTFDSAAVTAITSYRDGRPCLDVWQNPTYVNWAYNGVETGSITQPWNTIFEGLDACLVGGTLNVQAGNYFQNPNIFKAKTINALNGTVRIGN